MTTRLVLLFLLAAAIALMAAGCASESDSEIPWNSPQGWEGNPAIPGMPTR